MSVFATFNFKKIRNMLFSVAIAEGVGFLSAWISGMAGGVYYDSIIKPDFSPPGIVFAVVWPILYALMGIAAYLVYEKKTVHSQNAVKWYAASLAANFLWPVFFFRFHLLGFSAIWLILLIFLVLNTIMKFAVMKKLSGVLMLPYILWLLYAFYLNYSIWLLN